MTDFIVLGAGMVGVTTALALQESGHHVTVVDRNPSAFDASYGNAGIIQVEATEPYGFPRDPVSLIRLAFGQLELHERFTRVDDQLERRRHLADVLGMRALLAVNEADVEPVRAILLGVEIEGVLRRLGGRFLLPAPAFVLRDVEMELLDLDVIQAAPIEVRSEPAPSEPAPGDSLELRLPAPSESLELPRFDDSSAS